MDYIKAILFLCTNLSTIQEKRERIKAQKVLPDHEIL